MERTNLTRAVNELEATIRESFQLGDEGFKDNRKEAIRLRRIITDKMAEMSSIADRALAGTALHGKFRSEFSSLRSTMAYHHAYWPIVAIDFESPDYLTSAAKLRESTDSFIAWLKGALSKLDYLRLPPVVTLVRRFSNDAAHQSAGFVGRALPAAIRP
jgi:hypothetical protein